jgi:Flp pilus assembly protein TadG
MTIKTSSPKIRFLGIRAQAMVEFAIVLPLLLVLLIGILEVGRMVFIYAVVTNASREAARFASAIGFSDNTYYLKYQYCSGIRDVAKKYGFLLNLQDSNIAIQYDQGPSTTPVTTKCAAGTTNDPTVVVKMGQDRVKIIVTANYSPMTKLIPITTRTFTATSYRTIVGNVDVAP